MAETDTLSAKEVARELDIDARTLRKFLRATTPKEDQPGQGNRWTFEQTEVKKLRKQFAEWQKPKARVSDSNGVEADVEAESAESPTVAAKPKRSKKSKDPVVHEIDEEPTAEELASIDLDEIDDLADLDLDEIELD